MYTHKSRVSSLVWKAPFVLVHSGQLKLLSVIVRCLPITAASGCQLYPLGGAVVILLTVPSMPNMGYVPQGPQYR